VRRLREVDLQINIRLCENRKLSHTSLSSSGHSEAGSPLARFHFEAAVKLTARYITTKIFNAEIHLCRVGEAIQARKRARRADESLTPKLVNTLDFAQN
jgi:hypothetical protein